MHGGIACPRTQALPQFLPQYGILTECRLAVSWLVYGISRLIVAFAPKTNRLSLSQTGLCGPRGWTNALVKITLLL